MLTRLLGVLRSLRGPPALRASSAASWAARTDASTSVAACSAATAAANANSATVEAVSAATLSRSADRQSASSWAADAGLFSSVGMGCALILSRLGERAPFEVTIRHKHRTETSVAERWEGRARDLQEPNAELTPEPAFRVWAPSAEDVQNTPR